MFKLLMAFILWAGLAQASGALTVEERLLAGLQAQGYTVLEQGYTFLGRLRIVAENDQIHREIVVNPGTGEILRDYAIYLSDLAPPILPTAQAANRDSKTASPSHTTVAARSSGTAGVAALTLTPGTSTLGSASLQVDTPDKGIPLDTTILPMSPDTP